MVSGASGRADEEHGTTARMRPGTEATWQGRGWPTRGAGGAKGADTWQEATRVHADACVGRHVAGGPHLEGPRVSGPWLGIWGCNANALPRPKSHTCRFFYFILCGTMFPHGSYLLQVTWRNRERWIDGLQVKHVDAMDNEST